MWNKVYVGVLTPVGCFRKSIECGVVNQKVHPREGRVVGWLTWLAEQHEWA